MRCILIQPRLTREQEIVLGNLTYNAGKMWNAANYLLMNGKASFNVFDLYNKLKDDFFVKNVQSRSAQILMGQLIEAWKTFFDYLKNPEKYRFPIRKPHFVDRKKPHHTVVYDKTGFKVFGTKLRLSIPKQLREYLKEYGYSKKYLWIDTGIDLTRYDVRNVQITPLKYSGRIFYQIGIVYSKPEQSEVEGKERLMGIDLNKANFAVIVVENHPTAYIIDGRGLMSLLRKYLKKIAKLQSLKDNLKNKGLPYNRVDERIAKLWKRVRNLLRDFSHKASNLIAGLARKLKVTKIIVGNIYSSKNEENDLPDLVNQMFSLLPHGKVVDHLRYKFGEVVEIDERYTSGVDSVKHEYPSEDNYEPWRRIKRSLFKSVIGLINADVNAARNIIKKCLFETGRTDHPFLKDTASGLKQVVRLRVFRKLKGSSESAVLEQIGVARGCVPLGAVRLSAEQTRPEAPCASEG
ncbi:transposase, IS605 OrfB family, central region [Archaeoglobus sulfaticallidus PM70-1]|uniref:Transposase, IS605 OrfB family, central region n=1 Tax=Archaeoglobus sulfaticallidus PM70-1 TaxID=387631 RepID=N0BMD4_9EURY|nr:transposase, IS605 OrfB family, central region [Archaeoglobus sulfaticallidus PM70-1]